eukprot:scaffold170055_cov30-Tisochrysis_lutea.AAC.2
MIRLALPHSRHSNTSASLVTYTCDSPSTNTPLHDLLDPSRIERPPAFAPAPCGCRRSRTTSL